VTTPKVSVAMIAYNHERFVAQSIESVLAQRTDFDFEIVFGEDCSTDGTRAIVERIATAHMDRIRLLLPPKNLGMNRNLAATIEACRGQYIALLEGDDFWIDPEKLQRQAEFLDAHPECAICFTRAKVVDEENQPIDTRSVIREVKPVYSLEDYLSRVFQPRTCTVMFRRRLFAGFPDWFFRLPVGDFPLHVLNAERGTFGFLDRFTAAYRIHAGGVWSVGINPLEWHTETPEQRRRAVARLQAVITVYETVRTHLGARYAAITRAQIARFAQQLTYQCRALEDWPQMRRSVRWQLRSLPLPEGASKLGLLRAALVSHLPFLARKSGTGL
jgi:glycosyltransferase involved in cell wall biosynthesis